MSVNLDNYGVAVGRLASDIRVLPHKDGSKTVAFTVFTTNNYTNSNGETGSKRVPVEGFVPANRNLGGLAYIRQGDLVRVDYEVDVDRYEDKNGETVYATKLKFDTLTGVKIDLESKAVRVARALAREAAGKEVFPPISDAERGESQPVQQVQITPELIAQLQMAMGGGQPQAQNMPFGMNENNEPPF